jgi:hypothetical protein
MQGCAVYLVKNKAIHRISLCPDLYRKAERNQMRFPLERGPRKIVDFSGQRGGEEHHVAIPTVTYTSNLMYHLKTEKTLVFYNLNPYCINGVMNHLCPLFQKDFLIFQRCGLYFSSASRLLYRFEIVLDTTGGIRNFILLFSGIPT